MRRALPAVPSAAFTPAAAPLPWLAGDAQSAVLWCAGRMQTRAAFAARATAVAAALPAGAQAVINLCVGRGAFLAGFAAALHAGLPTLLLPARTADALGEVQRHWPGSVAICEPGAAAGLPARELPELMRAAPAGAPTPHARLLPDAQVALIGHTSGSTGTPQAHRKPLRALWLSNAANHARLAAELGPHFNILATVPPQHMYGIELSVLLPLLGGCAVADAQPLLPADVAAELARLPSPRLLVSTPLHLRALLDAGVALPCEAIASATAPLDAALARAVERHTGAPLIEVYGSTETCVVAARRTAREDWWTPYAGVVLQPQPDGVRVQAPQLPAPLLLGDRMECAADGRFRLLGRVADLVEIAGKRASLADLTRRLRAVPGVEDAVLWQQDAADAAGVHRLAALVVAPTCSEAQLLAALRAGFDAAFLPRPLRCVPALPRNALGKLPRSALEALLRSA